MFNTTFILSCCHLNPVSIFRHAKMSSAILSPKLTILYPAIIIEFIVPSDTVNALSCLPALCPPYDMSYMFPIEEIIYHPLYIRFHESTIYINYAAPYIYPSLSIFDYRFYELYRTSCALYVGCMQYLKPRIGCRCLAGFLS